MPIGKRPEFILVVLFKENLFAEFVILKLLKRTNRPNHLSHLLASFRCSRTKLCANRRSFGPWFDTFTDFVFLKAPCEFLDQSRRGGVGRAREQRNNGVGPSRIYIDLLLFVAATILSLPRSSWGVLMLRLLCPFSCLVVSSQQSTFRTSACGAWDCKIIKRSTNSSSANTLTSLLERSECGASRSSTMSLLLPSFARHSPKGRSHETVVPLLEGSVEHEEHAERRVVLRVRCVAQHVLRVSPLVWSTLVLRVG